MSAAKFVQVYLGDVVRLRKQHPCGGTDWAVVRVGADIGLKCQTEKCQRRILLPRSEFERRLKTFVSRSAAHAVLHSAEPMAPHGAPAEPRLDPSATSSAEPISSKEPSSD
jgi:hypothetical protein